MFDLLLLTGVVGSFLVNLPGRVDGDELFVRYFLALVLILSFFLSPKRKIKSNTLGVFLLVSMASVFMAYRTPVIGMFKEVLLGLLAVKVTAERETLTPAMLGKALSIFWLCFNVLLLAQAFGCIFQGSELAGSFVMPWMMGSAAVLSIPFVKSFNVWWCLLLLPAVLLSHSTACAVVALILFIQPKRISWKVLGYVTIAFLAYILFFDFSFESTRFQIWENTAKFIRNPFLGNGIGSWLHMAFYRMNGETPIHWTTAHNLYYQTFFEMGALGLASLIAVLLTLWSKSHGPCRSALLGLLMLSFVHPIVHFPRFAVFLVLLVAMILQNDGVKERIYAK